MNIKYSLTTENDAEWGNKDAILKRYEGLNRCTLNRWIGEMRAHKVLRTGVVNPTHKLVFINFAAFDDFLYWKTHGYSKIKAK